MTDTKPDNQQTEALHQQIAERLAGVGGTLHHKLAKEISARDSIEQRWLTDMRQLHGQYDHDELSALTAAGGSRAFVNVTRSKVTGGEARLQDMLFPVDDRNWGIKPTPVPELDRIQPGTVMQGPNGEPLDAGAIADQISKEASDTAELMQTEIDDLLTESRYQIQARDVIHDAAVLGTGILKGPVILGRQKRSWRKDPETGVTVLEISEEIKPSVERVDPWDFYPDSSARTMDECEHVFQRHRMTKLQLKQFARIPGVIKESVRSVLQEDSEGGVTDQATDYTNELRSINGNGASVGSKSGYEIWEYHGPIDKQDLLDAMTAAGETISEEEVDALDDTVQGVVFFCGEYVLKVALNPQSTEDLPYSVFCWERDESSIFGLGIPYLLRGLQMIINTAWRMMLDNANASSSDIIVANRDVIQPADGSWTGKPGLKKLFFINDKNRSVRDVFAAFTMPNHQGEFQAILTVARQLADEETNLPLIAQGEQSAHVTKTSSGMAMLMNSANIVLRRAVKNWDDDVTRTLIQRFYDWLMEHSDKEEIKGDYNIDARGSGALLVREKQQESLMMFANLSAQNPELAIRRDWEGIDKEMAKALEVPYHQITLSDGEIEQKRKAQAEQAQSQGVDPIKQAELQLKQQQVQAEIQLKQQQMQIDAQLAQQKLDSENERHLREMALKQQITVAELRTKLQIEERKDQTSREQSAGALAQKGTEISLKAQNQALGFDTYG